MRNDELEALVNEMACRGGMGGLDVGTIYGDLALDVAKAVREWCAKLCDDYESGGQDWAATAACELARQIRDA